MEQTNFGSTSKTTKLESLSKEQLIERNTVLEFEVGELVKELYRLRNQKITDEQLHLIGAVLSVDWPDNRMRRINSQNR